MITCAALVVGLHVGTHHFSDNRPHKAFNPGLYAACDALTAGVLRNSSGHLSVYAGYMLKAGPVDVLAGGMTGYRDRSVRPMLVPSVRLGSLPARVSLLLPVDERGGGVHLSIEKEF
jgi:hypothetical protein